MHNDSKILIYQTEDGLTRIDVKLVDETIWLTQAQMAELFQRERSVITKHISNTFEEGELVKDAVCANFAHTAVDGKIYQVDYYNLDVIISVGYRVKSHQGTKFRIWATQRLREYFIKGFTIDDVRLAEGRTADNYFDELIERVRAIRTSELNIYHKVLDIYSTSIDYDPKLETSREFFATVQNKLHWAIHGHTAAEIIYERADGTKNNMGLTNHKNEIIKTKDVKTAKNYLSLEELKEFELLVDQYLSFAELQAFKKKPMSMKDWETKLDQFLTLNEREILQHAGRISKDIADKKAIQELEKYRTNQDIKKNIQNINYNSSCLKV